MKWTGLTPRTARAIRLMTDTELRDLLHEAVKAGYIGATRGTGFALAQEGFVLALNANKLA